MVRIAKELRCQMKDLRYPYAQESSSFGVECLLWNIPNEYFTKYTTYRYAFDEIVSYLYDNRYSISDLLEANNIKKLCDTIDKINIYKGFIEELKGYYEYEI